MNKKIFHIDIDNFFIAVEKNLNPKLDVVNIPTVISKNTNNGMVATSNYLARKYNISGGTPLFIAKQLCKNLQILEPHYEVYNEYSNKFIKLFFKYTKNIETVSVDECYIDFTNKFQSYKNAKIFAWFLKKYIKDNLNLEVSIGISFTKFLAKIATNIAKPNSVVVIDHNNIENILGKQKIKSIYFIGKQRYELLNKLNIQTVNDFINYNNYEYLHKEFGINYISLLASLKGWSNNYVSSNLNESIGKSISHSVTFSGRIYIHDWELQKSILNMLKMLINDLNINHMFIKCITIKYKLDKSTNKWVTNQKTLNKHTNDFYIILNIINKLILQYISDDLVVKGIGIGLSKIIDIKIDNGATTDLLQKSKIDHKTLQIIRESNKILNKSSIYVLNDD